jgi:hypothetical protein
MAAGPFREGLTKGPIKQIPAVPSRRPIAGPPAPQPEQMPAKSSSPPLTRR